MKKALLLGTALGVIAVATVAAGNYPIFSLLPTGTSTVVRTLNALFQEQNLSLVNYGVIADAQACAPLISTTALSGTVVIATNTLTADGTIGVAGGCNFGTADVTGAKYISVSGAGGTVAPNGQVYGSIASVSISASGVINDYVPSLVIHGIGSTNQATTDGGADAMLSVTAFVNGSTTIVNGGTGCTNGAITLTVQGGPSGSTPAQIAGTCTGGVVTALGSVLIAGSYTGLGPAVPAVLSAPGMTTLATAHLTFGVPTGTSGVAVVSPTPGSLGGYGYNAAGAGLTYNSPTWSVPSGGSADVFPTVSALNITPATQPMVALITGVQGNTISTNGIAAVTQTSVAGALEWCTPSDTGLAHAVTDATALGGRVIFAPAQNASPYCLLNGQNIGGNTLQGAGIAPHIGVQGNAGQPWFGFAREGTSFTSLDPVHPAITTTVGGSVIGINVLQEQIVQSPDGSTFSPIVYPPFVNLGCSGGLGNNTVAWIWTGGTTHTILVNSNAGADCGNLVTIHDVFLGDLITPISSFAADWNGELYNIQEGNYWLGSQGGSGNVGRNGTGIDNYRSLNTTCLMFSRWDNTTVHQINCGVAYDFLAMQNDTEGNAYAGYVAGNFSNVIADTHLLTWNANAGVYSQVQFSGLLGSQLITGSTDPFIQVSDQGTVKIGSASFQGVSSLANVGSGVGGELDISGFGVGVQPVASNSYFANSWGAHPLITGGAGSVTTISPTTLWRTSTNATQPLFSGAGAFTLNGNSAPDAEWLDTASLAIVSAGGTGAGVTGTLRNSVLTVGSSAITSATLSFVGPASGTLPAAPVCQVTPRQAGQGFPTVTSTTTQIVVSWPTSSTSGVFNIACD